MNSNTKNKKQTTKITWKKWKNIFYNSGYYTIMHDGIEHAGYLAFLALLSIFPFLVLVIALATGIGRREVGSEFIARFMEILPEDAALALTPRINEILTGPPQSLLTIAIIGMIWTASSAVEGTRTILNRVYRVSNPPIYIYRRLMSIAQFIIITFVVIVAMIFITLAPTTFETLSEITHIPLTAMMDWYFIRYIFSAFIVFICIAISYHILPNIKQSFIYVLPGALIALVFWLLVAYIFSSYIHYYKQFNIVYGSLAGIIITLLFFYILAIIYIFGAEFNYFLEKALGKRIEEKSRKR